MRSEPTRTFPLADILSITTERLISASGMGGVYAILSYMTRDTLFTHQLPRACDECKPWLLRWFPELHISNVNACLASLDRWIRSAPTCPSEGIKMWLTELRMMHPKILAEYAVSRIPVDDHDVKDPYDELVAMRGTDEGLAVINFEDGMEGDAG